jgi:hypothetical protein
MSDPVPSVIVGVTLVAATQRVTTTTGSTWTVVGSDLRVVEPVEQYLEFARDSVNRPVTISRTHSFRHTRATNLLNAGVPLHVVMRYFGHVTPAMTMHYAKTLSQTAERESRRFRRSPPTVASWTCGRKISTTC